MSVYVLFTQHANVVIISAYIIDITLSEGTSAITRRTVAGDVTTTYRCRGVIVADDSIIYETVMAS